MNAINAFLARFGYFNHPYISLLTALCLMLFGAFVFLKDLKTPLNRAFLFITWTLAQWFFGNALSMLHAHDLNKAILWASIGYSTAPLMSLAYYHFYITYTGQFQKRKFILLIILLISIAEILWLWFSNDVKVNARALPHVGVYWYSMPRWSWVTTIGMLKYFTLSIITGVAFLNEYKKEKLLNKKKQLKSLAAIFFILSMGATEWLVVYGITIHMAWMVAPVFMLALAYSIISYKTLEIETVVHQTILWAITVTLLILPGLIVAVNLKNWLGLRNTYFHYFLLVLYFIFYINCYQRIRPGIDHLFRRRKYDYQTILGKIAERIATSININELTSRLLAEISNTMYLRNALVYIISKDESRFILAGEHINSVFKQEQPSFLSSQTSGPLKPDNMNELLADSPFCQWLMTDKDILEREQVEVNPRFTEIRETALRWFSEHDLEVAIPIVYNEKMNALLGLGKKENLQSFNKKDIQLLKKLSQEAGVTVFNALHFEDLAEKERLEQEMRMGQQIQKNLLPHSIPDVSGLVLHGMMNPAKEIGGDYYDFLPVQTGDGIGIVIGDVSGKGVAAGLCMAIVKPVIHLFAREETSPKNLLLRVNQVLNQHLGGDKFMTLLYLIWQTSRSRILYSSAGHEHLLVFRQQTDEVEELESGGIILGIMADIEQYIEEKEVLLQKGDKVLLYTDGITEAHNSQKDRFGIRRLKESFKLHSKNPPEELIRKIKEDLAAFMGSSPQYDDITLVILQKV